MLSNRSQLIYQTYLTYLTYLIVSINLSNCFIFWISIYFSSFLSVNLSICLSIHLPIYLSTFLPFFPSIFHLLPGSEVPWKSEWGPSLFITVPISEMCVISKHDWIHGCQCQVFSSPFVQKWYKVGPKTSYNWSYGAPINDPTYMDNWGEITLLIGHPYLHLQVLFGPTL